MRTIGLQGQHLVHPPRSCDVVGLQTVMAEQGFCAETEAEARSGLTGEGNSLGSF